MSNGNAVTVAKNPERNEQKVFKCFICFEGHSVLECPQFCQSADRIGLLKQHKICIYCVQHKYDHTKPCRKRNSLKCETCGKDHIKETHSDGGSVQTHYCQEIDFTKDSIILPTAV